MTNFRLFTSNRLEILAEALAEVLRTPLSSPLEPEIIVIQSQGMQRWLSMELARHHGICANDDFPFPNTFVRRIFHQVLVDIPERSPFEPGVLTWKIMKVLPQLITQPGFESLRIYLEDDDGDLKRYQLSERIADLFDQYLLYRPGMISQWEKGGANHWQASIWRVLVKGHEAGHRAALGRAFFKTIQETDATIEGLPERISVFGISALPPFHIQVLAGLSRFTQINLFLMNPCREYWGDILSDREIKRTRSVEGLEGPESDILHMEKGNSLIASMGTLGRDFFDMINELGCEEFPTFEEPGEESLLTGVQSDILNLRERGLEMKTEVSFRDRSIQIHSCHSPMREIEVLQDQLLHMFEIDPGLKPKDILVMAPDIETYAPYIQAVFDTPPEDARRIPFSIADRSFRNEMEIIEPFLAILDLWEGRFGVSQVLGILESPAVRGKFKLSEADLERVRGWVRETRIRWGIDGESRALLGLPAFRDNTWNAGLERLLLGYAIPGREENLIQGLLPYDEIEGSEAQVLGNLLEFTEGIFSTVKSFRQPMTLKGWFVCLSGVLDHFFEPEEETEREMQVLRRLVGDLTLVSAPEGGAFEETVGIKVIRAYLGQALGGAGFGHGFITGGVTFCAMLQMRSIPFKVICLVGMDHDAYPRESRPLGFDFMAKFPRHGDRSRRLDDRYLFLEAILSARQVLYISHVGQSVRDNSQVPPSVLVSEVTDYIEQGFEIPGQNILDHILTRHRLQAFSPSYFGKDEKRFSYSEENCRAAQCLMMPQDAPDPFITDALPEPDETWRRVDLEDLGRFFTNPAKFLLNRRLGITLEEGSMILEDREAFEIRGLDRYLFENRLLEQRIAGKGLDEFSVVAKASGQLPPGTVGECVYENLSRGVEDYVEKTMPYLGDQPLEPIEIDIHLDEFRLTGRIEGLFPERLVRHRYARIKPGDHLKTWIYHLALNSIDRDRHPRISLLTGLSPDHVWEAWIFSPVENSTTILRELLEIYRTGLTRPLHFFPESSWVFAQETLGKKGSPDKAVLKARNLWKGSAYHRGECEDAYYQLCFRNIEPTNGEFQRLAEEIFGPLLMHQSEPVK
jgi:exodeoxyribonuclease V gamma subunit